MPAAQQMARRAAYASWWDATFQRWQLDEIRQRCRKSTARAGYIAFREIFGKLSGSRSKPLETSQDVLRPLKTFENPWEALGTPSGKPLGNFREVCGKSSTRACSNRVGAIWYQFGTSGTNVVPIWYQSGTNLAPISDQSGTDLVPIWCQSVTNVVKFWYQSGTNQNHLVSISYE